MNRKVQKRFFAWFIEMSDKGVSVMIMFAIMAVMVFSFVYLFKLFGELFNSSVSTGLQFVSVLVILVKAYRLLVFYMVTHHVSIRYIVEISIIAPAIELIFVPHERSLALNITYAVFSIAMLVIYVIFYKRITEIDDTETVHVAGLINSEYSSGMWGVTDTQVSTSEESNNKTS